MSSPVLHRMVVGNFRESTARRAELDEVDPLCFARLLELWSGKDCPDLFDLGQLVTLASTADRFQMTEVAAALEQAVVQHLSVETCADMLAACAAAGLTRAEEAAQRLALKRFEEVATRTSPIP